MSKNKKRRIEESRVKTEREHNIANSNASDDSCVYPLYLLREYTIANKEIIQRDNHIIFGEVSWPKDVKTNLVRFCKPAVKEYYTLESLLFFLKNINEIHPEYCRAAVASNIETVRRPDRKNVIKYLTGVSDTCASIDKSAPPEKPTRVKHEYDEESEAGTPISECNLKKEQEEKIADPNSRLDGKVKALKVETCVKKEQEEST